MSSVRLRTACVLAAIVVAALAGTALARSRQTGQEAVLSGRVFLDGGAPGPLGNGLHPRSGTVIVRNDSGQIVARTHATAKHGFRLSLPPGGYELSALVIQTINGSKVRARNCPAEHKVTLHAGKNPPVRLFVACETP